MTVIETDRLIVRSWCDADREPFAALNADLEVMRYMPSPLTRSECDAVIDRMRAHEARHGFCFWPLEVKGGDPFIGFTGLAVPRFDAPFMPAVEIGWRLAHGHWGKGYATEAATAVITHAFETLGLDEIVSFTAEINTRSRAVMERIGMIRDHEGDFDHPSLAPGHRLSRHVLYRISRSTACNG